MPATLAFDVYGTLIDTQGVVSTLKSMIGDKATAFSQTWREKQLEYSFRRGLMETYENFGVCTSQALAYTCEYYAISLTEAQRLELLASYSELPAFDDVADSLKRLNGSGFQLYAFSNGSKTAVEQLLQNAGIRQHFRDVVSCDDISTFKPNPAVYTHFLKESASSPERTWLISSNPFDVIGAISAGMRAAWVQRSGAAVFDPWGIEPDVTITGLDELDNNPALAG